MKIRHYLFLLVSTLSLSACTSEPNILIADFEGNTYGAWMLEGNAFGQGPTRKKFHRQQLIEGYKGIGFVNSYNKEGGDARGVLTSPKFVIQRDYINFLIGGGKSKDAYIELVIDDKATIRSSSVYDSNRLYPMSWNVEKYKGKEAQIRIVDYQRGESGYILIDHIEQSNKPSTNILYNYAMTFNIDKKYLLIPVEEDAPEIKVSICLDDPSRPLSTSYMRLSNTVIDYYIALDLSGLDGRTLKLVFDQIDRNYVALSDIKQSDTYTYNYEEAFRPSYHFSSIYGWLGNPNGLVYDDGTYNLYYQHNPYGSMWGNLSWAHATSHDLINWKHESISLKPDSLGEIFSGSAILDKDNTAGFGKDAIIAIYTSDGLVQSQSISYSLDGGKTFDKYLHNPVLSDPKYSDFRDPNVFWFSDSNSWIMSLATANTVTFYSSPNLKDWTLLSQFGENVGSHSGLWETPNLFPLQYKGSTKWVLLVSVNAGGPSGGSATQYFIGDFDGTKFVPDDLPYPLWLDYGRDNYGSISWSNAPDNRRLIIGWMSNWDYSNYVPTLNFRNGLTIPRELSLGDNGEHLVLKNYPVKEVELLRDGQPINYKNFKVDNTAIYSIDHLLKDNQGAYEILMTIKPNSSEVFSFELENDRNEWVAFIFNFNTQQFTVNRTQSGLVDFVSNFASRGINAPLKKRDSYQIRLLVDKASTELFINGGEIVQTNTVFPREAYNELLFSSDAKIMVEDLKIYKLKNISED